MKNLFPHTSLYVEKGKFTFQCQEWPSIQLKNFFESLPEFLEESGFFETSETATGESSEIVISAVHHAATLYTDSENLGQEDCLTVLENFIVVGVVYVENLSAGIIMCDFSGSSSDSDDSADSDESEEWGD